MIAAHFRRASFPNVYGIETFFNPRTMRTRVGSVCLSVYICLLVCLRHISPLERLFVLKRLSRNQRATKVKKIVVKMLRFGDSYGHTYRRPFFTLDRRKRYTTACKRYTTACKRHTTACKLRGWDYASKGRECRRTTAKKTTPLSRCGVGRLK